jgi:diaminopimelate epimerase
MHSFYKYNSTGNDFVVIDNRSKLFLPEPNYIRRICNRNFGVGADGLILLERSQSADYFTNYFNSDGFPSTFCGNGSLCCAHFANIIDVIEDEGSFETREGLFQCSVENNHVSISMQDVLDFELNEDHVIINTGSPHYVVFVDDLNIIDMNVIGKKIRNKKEFYQDGINVTFATLQNKKLSIRTYERGVESETLSCGTGAVAAVMTAALRDYISTKSIDVVTVGGVLNVAFQLHNLRFSNIVLSTDLSSVFKGQLNF